MAIFAQRTAFRSSAFIPDIKITGPSPANKDILIWSSSEQAFVNGDISCILPPGSTGTGTGTIVDGLNIGAGAQVFDKLSSTNSIMDFRTITGNDGITVIQDGAVVGEINITNDIITNAEISVPNSFKLVIDNDNTTSSSAKFEIFSNFSVGSITLVPTSFIAPALDIEVIADPLFVINGQFKTTSGDFIASGFEVGMCLLVSGTGEQDGVWIIDTVTIDTITITVPFPDATDAGFQPATTLDGLHFNIVDNQTIQIFGSDLTTFGFAPGLEFSITNSTDNDGTYTINTVATDTLTINETFPGSLGCDVNNIVITTTPATLTTGWWVNELGEMVANDTTINGDLTVTNEIFIQGQTLLDFVASNALNIPENGIVTQTSSGIFVGRSIVGTTGIVVTNGDGIAGDPTLSVNDFTITLGDELAGNVVISSLGSATLNASLANLPQFAGLDGNSFNRVTIDGAGRVTFGENQSIIGVNGIIVTNGDGVSAPPVVGAKDFKLIFNGDVFGSGTVVGLSDVAIDLNLPDLIVPNSFNNVTVDSKGRVIAGFTDPLDFQPADSNLDNLADGMDNPGYLVWDGTAYIDRQIEGTVNQIDISDGNGQSANTVVKLADDAVMPGSGAITIPTGTSLQQPSVPTDGMIRFNTDSTSYDVFKNGSWKTIAIIGEIIGFLPITGGMMTGDIVMDDNDITFTTGLVDGRDVSADGVILDNINTGTGMKVQTGPDTFSNREIKAILGEGLRVTDGFGVLGNPSLGIDLGNIPSGGLEPNYVNDTMVYYDASAGVTKSTTVGKINRRQAFRYFMAQF